MLAQGDLKPMAENPTCGQGLAHHAALPSRFADVVAAIADNLEAHLGALDSRNAQSRPEHEAYVDLARQHREIAERLRSLSAQMAGYKDLPMAEHDMTVMSSSKTMQSFKRLVDAEQAAAALLRAWIADHRAMLAPRDSGNESRTAD